MAKIGYVDGGSAVRLADWGRVAELRGLRTFRSLLMVDFPLGVVVVKRKKLVVAMRRPW